MPRTLIGAARAKRKRRLRADAKGYFGARSKQTHTMISAVLRAGAAAYRDRRRRKREFRALWITRITAACRSRGTNYSRFMNGLKISSVGLNRKMLSEIAIVDEAAFDKIVELARSN